MNEDRQTEIEIKLTRQEDLLDTLNQTVFRQQRKIEELETLCSALARRVRELADGIAAASPGHEKPPHY